MREGRLAEVETLFESLVGLPPEARLRVLAERCSTDAELRVFVERMLANYDHGMGSFLQPLQPFVHPVSSRLDSSISSADLTALPTTFALGERVAERYRVERLLGQGGMGEVYEVWDDELTIPMALKTLRFKPAQERAIRRLKQEAMLARAVVHPNVCRVYDLGRHADTDHAVWFLTMEVLRGDTLRERLRSRGRFTPEEALPLVKLMAAGLGAAHQAGVVHGDFKSGNVMLVGSPEGEQAVIADFGLAREVRDRPDEGLTSEERHGIAGTPAYMAPEQVRGESAGTAADIYALGVVLYEMVTGSLPFTGRTPWEAAIATPLGTTTLPPGSGAHPRGTLGAGDPSLPVAGAARKVRANRRGGKCTSWTGAGRIARCHGSDGAPSPPAGRAGRFRGARSRACAAGGKVR